MSAVSALSKNKYTIKAESTTTINFLGSNPNHYYIINGGNTALYVGISMMPTEDFFDAKIPSASSKLCADAYGHKEIYIYNPSIEDANIIVTSFEAPFEPETLAMTGIGQDMTSIELAGEFDAKGDLKANINKIVEILNKPSDSGWTEEEKSIITTNLLNISTLNSEIRNLISFNSVDDVMPLENTLGIQTDLLFKLQSVIGIDSEGISIQSGINNIQTLLGYNTYTDGNNLLTNLETIISKLTNIQTALKPGACVDEVIQITNWNSDGTYPVTGTAWSYVGEVVTHLNSDAITVEWCVRNGTNITNTYTIEEWNKVCHTLRCGTVSFKTTDTSLHPYITLVDK